jgi:energy-coupling factor transporter transmembrane protein EcfT
MLQSAGRKTYIVAYRLVFHYFPGDSVLHRWDARCKFLGLALATFGLLHMNERALVLFSIFFVVAVANCRLPLKPIAHDLKAWSVFLFFIFLVQALGYPDSGEVLFTWLPLSEAGLYAAVLTCWRLGLVLCYGVLFTLVTRPRDLQNALIWFLKPFPLLPAQRIALMVTLTLRLLPLIMDQLEEVSLATRSRLGNQRKGILRRAKFLVLPVFYRSLIRSDELALALAARGYNESRPIFLTRVPLTHFLSLGLVVISVVVCSPQVFHLVQEVFAGIWRLAGSIPPG